VRCRGKRSPPTPFDQLRNFAVWWRDSAKNATCCERATDEELREDPDAYDCATCELKRQADQLWVENAEAWDLYQRLCGRAVRDYHLEGWLVQQWTEGWDFERISTLLDRLNLIASVLEPHGRSQT